MCASLPPQLQQPLWEEKPPKLSLGNITDDPQPRGKQIENQYRWHGRNEKEALGGGGVQPSQGKQWRVQTPERRGNLVPAVFHYP